MSPRSVPATQQEQVDIRDGIDMGTRSAIISPVSGPQSGCDIVSTLQGLTKAMTTMQQEIAGLQRNNGMAPIFQHVAEMKASAPVQRAVLGITPAEN